MSNTINNIKALNDWKALLSKAIIFMSSKDTDETSTLHSKTNNKEIMYLKDFGEINKVSWENSQQFWVRKNYFSEVHHFLQPQST